MTARLVAGWLVVPYAGPELGRVHIATGRHQADEWKPAYLDYLDGERVAKVRPPAPTGHPVQVWIRVNGAATAVGHVTI
ncbi:hypothetical protein E1295_31810 [Nonomuraea mesophila]|uniref:Uncharacterized protein n=1 Tax=Nonomuraea mesophila TaxID=2530382 RepID=A0A4R5F058_9ACTN|nr:hypothetical protein [Nonomuraea mesophila]TDE40487.1 hypothetical protein E1295_31810 [Nonomuraea mesophila]